MNNEIKEILDYYQDTEFDKTMKDIKDNLIARINRQEKEIEKWKWQKELLIKRDKEHQKEIIKLKTLLSNICYELEGIVRTTEKIGITKNIGYVLSQHNIDLIKKIILKIDEENNNENKDRQNY